MLFEGPRPEPSSDNPDIAYRREQLEDALQTCSETSDEERGRVIQELQAKVLSATDPYEQEALQEQFVTKIAAALIHSINTEGLPDKEGTITVRGDQVASIAALLENTSLHAPTGSGKTSVVIPIAALARAFGDTKPLIVETASPELVSVLKEGLIKLSGRLPEALKGQLSMLQFSESPLHEADSRPREFDMIAKHLIENNAAASSVESPSDVLTIQRQSLFGKLASGGTPQFQNCITEEKTDTLPDGPAILVGLEGPSRFLTMRQPGSIGSVIADEADIAFNRNTSYLTTIEPGIITPEAAETYMTDRLVASVVATLADEMGDPERLFDTLADPSLPEFRAAIHIASTGYATHLGVDPAQLEAWFMNRMITAQTAQLSVGGSLQDVFSAQYLAYLQAKDLSEGSHYSVGRDNVPVVRDYFVGLQLPSHQFQYQVTLALQAQHEAFEYRSPDVAERDASSFQGAIVNSLRGRYTGLSGTFFSRELSSDNLVRGNFATFIERATGKEPVHFAPEEARKVPIPSVESADRLEQRLLDETSDERQLLIACFNEQDGKMLQEKLAEAYPDRVCILISDSLTDTETNELLTTFADTDRAIIISTGRTGVGVDIKTSGGAHTDHKTILYGIPFAQTQVFQALGRRRLGSTSESDTSWIIDRESLETHPYFLSLEEGGRERVRRDLVADPLRSMDRLISRGVEASRVSDERHLQVDRAYRIVRQQFEAKLRTGIPGLIDDVFASDPDGRTLLSAFLRDMRKTDIETYAQNIVGCPAELYWQVRRQLQGYSGYGSSAYHRLIGSLDTTVASDEAVSEWLETKRDEVRYTLQTLLAGALQESVGENADPETCHFVSCELIPIEDIAKHRDTTNVRIMTRKDPESGATQECGIAILTGDGIQIVATDDPRAFAPLTLGLDNISLGVLYETRDGGPQT